MHLCVVRVVVAFVSAILAASSVVLALLLALSLVDAGAPRLRRNVSLEGVPFALTYAHELEATRDTARNSRKRVLRDRLLR